MNNEERKEFWNQLIKLDGKNRVDDFQRLKTHINYPKHLYRYRPISNYALDNLRTNTLYFSRADQFDDPFDTYIHVETKLVEEAVRHFKESANIQSVVEKMSEQIYKDSGMQIISPQLKQLDVDNIMQVFDSVSKDTRKVIQKSIRAACFSEDGCNKALWLKYGQNHYGFCLIYDINKQENYLCGTKDMCKNCKGIFQTQLFPVYYSLDKLDASPYIEQIIGLQCVEALKKIHNSLSDKVIKMTLSVYGINAWWNEKISLIKDFAHNQDKEWRMLVYDSTEGDFIKKIKPCGIIMGLRTNETNKLILKSLAKEAGIKHIYQSKINENDELVAEEIFED